MILCLNSLSTKLRNFLERWRWPEIAIGLPFATLVLLVAFRGWPSLPDWEWATLGTWAGAIGAASAAWAAVRAATLTIQESKRQEQRRGAFAIRLHQAKIEAATEDAKNCLKAMQAHMHSAAQGAAAAKELEPEVARLTSANDAAIERLTIAEKSLPVSWETRAILAQLTEDCQNTAAPASEARSNWQYEKERSNKHRADYTAVNLEIVKIVRSLDPIDVREVQQYDSGMSTALALAIQDMEMAVRDLELRGWGGSAPAHMEEAIKHFKRFKAGLKEVEEFLQSESLNHRS